MKKRLACLVFALLLTLSLASPVRAEYSEYGLIYDGTDLLDLVAVRNAEEAFLKLIGQYDVDLRVDVITDTEGYALYDLAEHFYGSFEYGFGDARDGILLMLHLVPDGMGVAFCEAQFYCGGANAAMLADYPAIAGAELSDLLAEDAWAGDLTADSKTFAALMNGFATTAGVYLSGNADFTIPAQEEIERSPILGENQITDLAGLLSESEWQAVEAYAREVTETYECGVYAVLVEDFRDYGATPEEACGNIYESCELGYGAGRDAIVLLLSMDDRDYALRDFGPFPAEQITEYGFDTLVDAFLDDFAEDDWYSGLYDYVEKSASLLEPYEQYDDSDVEWDDSWYEPAGEEFFMAYGIALVAGLLVALLVCTIFKRQMRTAVRARSASSYVAASGVDMQIRQDVYTYTTRTERRIKEDRDHSSSGSGGNHSRSGKF